MTFFPPVNPNAAYIDEDTGTVVRPTRRSGGKKDTSSRALPTEPPSSNETPAFFNQGSPDDFLDINTRDVKGTGGNPFGILGRIWNGEGMFSGSAQAVPVSPQQTPGYYGPGGNPDGSGQGQAQQRSSTPAPSLTGRDEKRGGSTGTQLSAKGPDFPGLIQSLQAQGMNLGYQSVTMPTQGQANSGQTVGLGSATIASGINAGRTVNANDPKFQAYLDGEERIGDTEVTFEPGKAEVVSQTALDSTDQSRAISGGLSDALNDKEGMRSYMRNLYGGRDAQYDRRGAAFLNGGPDSMLSLRAANISQGFITQNGINTAIDAQGNPIGTFSDEGKQKLISQGYGTANSKEFLDQYQIATGLKNSQTVQSADSVAPGPASTMNPLQIASQQYTPLDQADFQPKDQPVLGGGPEVDLNTNYFAPGSNVMFNGNLREPLMRYK